MFGVRKEMFALEFALALPLPLGDNRRVPDPAVRWGDILAMIPEAEMAVLIEAARRGDETSVNRIYELFKRQVFALAYRHTGSGAAAEDILQDVFLRIFTHLDSVQNVRTFPAWIYRIALNACYSQLRQKRARGGEAVPLDAIEGRREEAVFDTYETSASRALEEAMRELPDGLRNVFLLHDVEGFKHREIARLLGCSPGTSKSQLFKARLRLRESLRKRQAA